MSIVIRVLLVEDVPDDADLLIRALKRSGFEAEWKRVESEEDLIAELNDKLDLVISDFKLPKLNAFRVLELVEQAGTGVPVVIVSGTIGEELAVDLLRHGAKDYLLKDKLARLGSAISHTLQRRTLDEARLRAERALAESEARFRALVEAAPDAVVAVGGDGTIQLVNRETERLFGYDRSELIGQSVEMLVPDRFRNMHITHRVRFTGDQHGRASRDGVALLARRRDGSEFPVEISLGAARSAPERVVIASIRDISIRTETEAALAESEARYRTLIETSFDGIALTERGFITDANRGFARIFGYSVEDVLSNPMTTFVAEESTEEVARRLAALDEGTFEFVGKKRDGQKIQIEAIVRNHTVRGRAARLSAVRDVTAQRLLEREFRHAQKMEAVGRLAGSIAHDFNNLLTVIISYTGLLLSDLPDGDSRRVDLAEIERAATTAASLTRQLLAFSRQQVLAPKVLELNDVVSGAENMLRRLIGEDVKLTTNLSADSGRVFADAGQLQQVIMNLAVNARDAMPDGGTLTIDTATVVLDEDAVREHPPTKPGHYAMLLVRDSGAGMSDDTKARIFEPFFTTKEVGKGTGLGLATVYGIVTQSGGFIWMSSEVGVGTTFRIYLPQVAEPVRAARHSGEHGTTRGTETILLVEDETAVRNITRNVLKREGYTVLEAASGTVAMDIASRHDHKIHLLLSDVIMPEMGGKRLGEMLAIMRPGLRILYMSGYTPDAGLQQGRFAPGVSFLQKPFTPQALTRKVREILDAD